VIHGGVTREERRKMVERFMQDRDMLVLIANDAAGEGVNLQRGHLMVTYDLPWNPYKIDQSAPNLNRYSATRRVARAVFMGTAPTEGQQNKGLDDKQINLGVVQPGERPAIFGDALRRLANQSKFMHGDLGRHWYSMSASLNRVAADRAGQFEEALILMEIDKALAVYINGLSDRGNFDAVQVAPGSSSDVPDDAGGIRAVVLGVGHQHSGRDGSEAMVEAKDTVMSHSCVCLPRTNPSLPAKLVQVWNQFCHPGRPFTPPPAQPGRYRPVHSPRARA
jgi:Helicase conserved C-terminal domain